MLRIDARELGTQGFRLQLENRDGDLDTIELAPSEGVTGTYEQDAERILLRGIRAGDLSLEALRWALPDGGEMELEAPGRLLGVAIDALIAIGPVEGGSRFAGTIKAGSIQLDARLGLPGATVEARGLRFGDLELSAHPGGHWRLTAASATVSEVRVELGSLTLSLGGLSIPDGLALAPDGVQLGGLTVRELSIEIRELPAVTNGHADAAPAEVAEVKESAPSELDLPFLDRLSGRVHADVVTDVTLPILGRRRATHRFRVAIDDGTIDFRALDRNLAFLEDLVVNFKVRKNQLVLEKDVPFIPFDRKTLVYWELGPEAEALAKRRRVKLRTLLRPRIPPPRKKEAREEIKKRGSPVALRRLEVGQIDIWLHLAGPCSIAAGGGHVHLGAPAHEAAVQNLSVQGELNHHLDDTDDSGELNLQASGLRAGLDRVTFGDWEVDAERVQIDSIEHARIDADGFEPGTVVATVRDIELGQVSARNRAEAVESE